VCRGHKGEIYTGRFHPSGNWLASAGMERLIYLWEVSSIINLLFFSEFGSLCSTVSHVRMLGLNPLVYIIFTMVYLHNVYARLPGSVVEPEPEPEP
jgi:WD40 repeat protein